MFSFGTEFHSIIAYYEISINVEDLASRCYKCEEKYDIIPTKWAYMTVHSRGILQKVRNAQ